MSFLKRHADLLIVILVGLVARLKLINANEFWYDEAFTGIAVRLPRAQFWDVLAKDVNPPLYYLAGRAAMTLGLHPDLLLRGISMLFGMGTVILVYLVAKKLFDNKETATLTALIVAISPFFTEYSVEARAYSMYGFLSLATFYSYTQKKWGIMIVFAILALATHYLATVFLANLALVLLIDNTTNKANKVTLTASLLVLCGLTAYYAQTNSQAINSEWVAKANLTSIVQTVGTTLIGLKTKLPGNNEMNSLDFFVSAPFLSVFVLAALFYGAFREILGIAKSRKFEGSQKNFVLVLALSTLPLIEIMILSQFSNYQLYVHRYLIPSSIFLIIALGYVLKKFLTLEVLFFVMVFYFFILGRVEKPSYYNGIKELAITYGKTAKEVVFTSPMEYTIGRYYFGENANIRLYDPQKPTETYFWWPLVKENPLPTNMQSAIFINPDESRFQNSKDYTQIDSSKSYKVYIKSPNGVE